MSTLESGSEADAAEGDEPLLRLDDVEVHFDPAGFLRKYFTDEKIRAVDGVTLDIEENDVVALVGESGCGKTTLGKTAVGLQRPTGGSVRFRGQDVWDAKDENGDVDIPYREIRRSLQIIHQDPGSSLNAMRTILSSLSDPLKKWRPDLGPSEREEVVYRLLSLVGLTPAQDYAQRYPHQLSGGEQQRVALGRALMVNPDLVLADEAISALDVSLRVEMMDLMLDLQDRFDTSYVFISHNLANARYLAEKADGKIGIMYLGHLVEVGDVDQILDNPKHPYTKVLRWATPPLHPEVAGQRLEERPPVRGVDVPDPSDPPPGCNFHPRCPEAREVCTQVDPDIIHADDGTRAACFRQDPDHEYWESDSIVDR